MKKLFLIANFILFSFVIFSQKRTISGFISDKSSGEKLTGATIIETNSKKDEARFES